MVNSDLTGRAKAAGRDSVRVVGFIGNCQAEFLHLAFRQRASADQIQSFYHFTHLDPTEREKAQDELLRCDDLLIQDIQNFDDYPLRDLIRKDTRIIRFPFLWFAAPWPYDDFNGLRDSAARAKDDPSLHTVTYYDGVLGRLRRAIPDPDVRLEAYRRLDVKALVPPQRVLDFEARRLEAQDARYESAIGKYILENFRSRPLFHTVNRPCGLLLGMLFDSLLSALEIDLACPNRPTLDELDEIQVPIHPKVVEALEMTWAEPGRLYNVFGQRLDWEGYVRAYIARYS